MAIVSFSKIRCYAPREHAGTLVEALQSLGVAELVPDTALPNSTVRNHHSTTTHAGVELARTFLAQYHSGDFWRTAFEGGRAHTTATELDDLATSYNFAETLATIQGWQTRLAELERSRKAHEVTLRSLDTFERLELPLSSVGTTRTTTTLAVRGAERLLRDCVADITAAHETETAITPVAATTALITYRTHLAETVTELIATHGLEIVTLPQTTKTGAELYTETTAQLAGIETELQDLTTTITAYAAEHLPALQKLSDLTRWQTDADTTAQTLPTTDRTAVATAWVPTSALPAIEAALRDALPASAVEVLDHGDEVPPTDMTNDALVQPFEAVTRLYGVPDHRDLDPTPLLAVFFFVFFGLCLSDVGYGLILMGLTGLVLWRYHVPAGTKQLLTLLFFGGLGTVFAGILFGGYLGVPPASIHPALVELQRFDPIANPLPVFYLSLALGFVQICFGIFLNLVRQVRLGQTRDGILDNAPWLLLFTLIALAIGNLAGVLPAALAGLITTYQTQAFIAAVVLLVLTQGRAQKNIFAKLLFGLLGLYGAVGYFADVLSYSRLMALGLATGALAFSINSIAGFVGGDSFGIGTIFMVLVLILGHTLNLAISILGTFINSARLQFVEFFSKFSTGTGRPFTPLRKDTRHTIILPTPPASG
jgi:V/A-type H+-transporting ATPase subunit I